MPAKKLLLEFESYGSIEQLPRADARLMNEAIRAAKNAYAPYSKFRVGAAVLLEDGTIVHGSNQENAAYPSGLCAERVALFSCGSGFPDKKIVAVAVTAFLGENSVPHPVSPCGDCRQVMAEFEFRNQSPIRVIMMTAKGEFIVAGQVSLLLPFLFSHNSLKPEI